MGAETADPLVIGGGTAGLPAAARVAADGGTVAPAETAEPTGGSARLAGFVWTTPSVEEMRRGHPDGDPRPATALVDGSADGVARIRSLGAGCRPPVPVLGFGRGHQVGTNHYLDTCERPIPGGRGAQIPCTRLADPAPACLAYRIEFTLTLRSVR